jgi:hypothetical protein
MKTIVYIRVSPYMPDICQKLKAEDVREVYEDPLFCLHFSVRVDQDSHSYPSVLRIIEEAVKCGGTIREKSYEVEYSEEDRDNAEYLIAASVFTGFEFVQYPGYRDLIHYYGEVTYPPSKRPIPQYGHNVQLGLTKTNKCPTWKKTRHFCDGLTMLDLFCSEAAKQTIEKSDLNGWGFLPVISAKTNEPIPDLWQFWPAESQDFFAPGQYYSAEPCPVCGALRYIPHDGRAELLVREDAFPAGLDFVRTPPCYGGACGRSVVVVSNKAYRFLKKANITRAILFTPLKVVAKEGTQTNK